MKKRICLIGGARYSRPLNATHLKKFQLLSELGDLFVVGFSGNKHLYCFAEYGNFYLFPQWHLPVVRYLTMLIIGPLLILWLVFCHKIQILVAQSPYEGCAAAIAKIIARWLGRRVALIVESHGDFEESIFLQRRVRWEGFYRLLMRHTASFALKHADLLRAVSNSTRAQLERWAPGKPIVQFAAWTDIEAFFEAGDKGQNYANAIVYVGVLIPRKGVHILLDAFAQIAEEFPDAQLWIIGRAENKEYAQSLKEQVKRLGLDGRVVFMDEMSQQELAQHIAKARVLVLPSLSEGLGRVIFEAMACGTFVIGSRVGGIQEMIEEGVTGFLVPPGDVKTLSERIRWVLNHPEEAKQMGQRAREFAQRFFSPQAYQKGYTQLFQMAEQILREGDCHAPASL